MRSLDECTATGSRSVMNLPVASLVGYGFLLGWSVAWPPGPINAEIARRSLVRGFWAGYGVCVGASFGDAIWAMLVALGVGVLFRGQAARSAMGVVSIVLLLVLAGAFLRGAWRGLRAHADAAPGPARFDGGRAGLLLGMTMALTSPWNLAFWLAAVGRPELTRYGTLAILVVASAVIGGALTWGVLWSASVVLLRRRAASRWWEVGMKAATGLLMLYFAAMSAWRLSGAGA
jgi:threonine/homoserine/homoserine lactone efflux protein